MLDGLYDAYDAIAVAVVEAAKQRKVGIASAAAERFGLVELGDGTPSQKHIWERDESGRNLRFEWRWYDQSKAFSIQPDMNILSLELRDGNDLVRRCEERFED